MRLKISIWFVLISFMTVAEDLSKLEQEVSDFLTLEKEIVTTKQKWAESRLILQQELALLKKKTEQLSKKSDQLQKNISAEKSDFAQTQKVLTTKSTKINVAKRFIEESLVALTELKKKSPAFVGKVITRVEAKIVDKKQVTKNLATIITAMDELKVLSKKWNFNQETVTIAQNPILCDIIFNGLSRGYALSLDGKRCFMGAQGKLGFIWTEKPEQLVTIKAAIDAYKDGMNAKLSLPMVEVKK